MAMPRPRPSRVWLDYTDGARQARRERGKIGQCRAWPTATRGPEYYEWTAKGSAANWEVRGGQRDERAGEAGIGRGAGNRPDTVRGRDFVHRGAGLARGGRHQG